MSMLDFKVLEYQPSSMLVVADPTLRNEMAQQGVRKLMRKTGLSQHTIEVIRAGQPGPPHDAEKDASYVEIMALTTGSCSSLQRKGEVCLSMINRAEWASEHGQITKIRLPDRCGGKTFPTEISRPSSVTFIYCVAPATLSSRLICSVFACFKAVPPPFSRSSTLAPLASRACTIPLCPF